ncbi:hypothetical protein OJAV_G00172000 [Oryzias javanicus]|uniref:Uncharacterized protein n=1 Tax=Oryzias javanicus TaxID=123683 RepID=A0A437CFE2_ORYJA|nr:hypothetical protein OJAV_G00172000 [Oryzias javanicus]
MPPSCGCSAVLHSVGGASRNLLSPFVVVQGSETEMVREELAVRLNDREYKNWLKAGRCLLILKDGLLAYTEQQMRSFHTDLLNHSSVLRSPCLSSSCKPRGNKLSSACRPCSEWQKVILMHHRNPDGTINWANCSPPLWRTDPWELAKAYMPRGQAQVRSADQCDASALLNLINYCKWFYTGDPKSARQVIQCRNELMHSSEFRVKDEWMKKYRTALQHFVQQFSHIPRMAAVGRQIEDMLAVDLSICIYGEDETDSACMFSDSTRQQETGAEMVSQWEAALLQEMLQECLHATADSEEANAQDGELLRNLGGFLRSNKDLGERFSTELQTITELEARE